MTLRKVAEHHREMAKRWAENGDVLPLQIIEAFESDPDFTLRERVETLRDALVLAKVLDSKLLTPATIAERLGEILNPPRKEGTT